MPPDVPGVVFVDRPIDSDVLRTLVERHFEDMVMITFALIGRGEALS